MMEVPVIAIDGNASSGKTSISKMLSKKLGFYFLDSGILYRTMGYIKLNENMNFDSPQNITDILNKIKLTPDTEKYFRVNFNNTDITNKLYTEDIGQQASIVSQYSLVREALLVLNILVLLSLV